MHAQTTLVDLALLGLLLLLLSSKSFSLCSSLDCLGFRFSVSDRRFDYLRLDLHFLLRILSSSLLRLLGRLGLVGLSHFGGVAS